MRRIMLVLFGLMSGLALFGSDCESRNVEVKEKKVEVKETDHGRKVETKEKKVITEPDGSKKEVETETKTKTKE